ncbi:50S ribosome-binding GTPase [Acinetobacter baumannii]|uniref:GTPase n=1 Tax=Acinetobacter baumannii TaxID=470 RepID=UPI002341DF02|nr:GTPase [Acinetobacter baumannii]MDC4624501.1 50S ribosome-binding GTPase [Acinetobacter baumannii]MDH2641786.1 50S ribosome-binding GTPase [Acinetobacter baumannii]HCJ6425093.1 50S ribosome-binding GTPase [Acinetobacter baumannii]HCK0030064.1 50S ribosome-binding GTPase [Acinetobacter baumannii]
MSIFDAIQSVINNAFKKEESIEDVVKNIQAQVELWESTEVKIAITGQSGSGKSSLINAIAGSKVAPVGFVETTMEPKEYKTENGIILVDLPGCGTANFPFETYIDDMQISSFDAIILVTANRFYEADIKLFNYVVNNLKKPIFLVRTKMDTAVHDGAEDNNLSRDEVIEMVLEDMIHNTDADPSKIYLVSSKQKQISHFDTARLINDISENLSDIKKGKFISESAAYSEDAIRAKKSTIIEVAKRYAYLSAANGINPVLGLNLSIDITLLVKLTNTILRSYGLMNSSIADYIKKSEENGKLHGTIQGISKWLAQYATEAGIRQILPKLALSQVSKTSSSWVPLIGQAIAAGIGYKMTSYYAEKLINESEEKAILALKVYIEDSYE